MQALTDCHAIGGALVWVGRDAGPPVPAAGGHGHVASRFRNRTMLYAVAAKVSCQSTSSTPRCRSFRVIRCRGEGKLPIYELDTAMPQLPQASDGLHPPKDLFHELPFPLTDVIARMPRGPAVDRTPASLLRHVGRDLQHADVSHKARHVVTLVRPDRTAGGRAGLQQQRAAARSAVPVAWVAQTLATSPCRLSSSTWPRYASLASFPPPFRCSIASGSVVDWCVSLRRRSPWKLTVGFPGSSGDRSAPRPGSGSSSGWPTLPTGSHPP